MRKCQNCFIANRLCRTKPLLKEKNKVLINGVCGQCVKPAGGSRCVNIAI